MRALLIAEQVSMLSQTPSAFYALQTVDAQHPDRAQRLALQTVVFGGEALEPQRLRSWLDGHPGVPRLVNMYGITETTVHASFREIAASDAASSASPIGVPLAISGFCAGRVVAAGAGGWSGVVCGWRRGGVRVCGPCRLTASRFVACRSAGLGRACIAPGIWCAGVLMGSCNMWAAPMSRSRSAGIASNWAKSRPPWPQWRVCSRRW
ncbi:AMP-binding enzyme family protein [Mycobacterium xenopi 4042]|uniref:AMP-binding enzyme family protein n=1 Tax=Mycobacterium xenopi 4042 TaxID=1299334 RepID=X8E8Q0_MYCXE|nr:AMP-binding enzyme family protein [Mycobacterium xenopi 4042]